MSVLSRRQKDSLLNDVARMINNNNHTAFANHAKISESVGNGDMKILVDAPKKEFVIRYGKKEIRINCNEQNIKELNEIIFNDNTKIKGISDTPSSSSSTAFSAKGAQQLKQSIDNIANKEHNHDDKYAAKEHNHDDKYAAKEHNHDNYQPKGDYSQANHNHDTKYADKSHNHDTKYADKNHSHYGINNKDDLEKYIKDITKDPWYIKLFKGIEIATEVVQTGFIAGLQAQITALHTAMASNGLVDSVQTMSTLGTALHGYADKFKSVANVIGRIGEGYEKVNDVCQKVIQPINTAAEYIEKGSEVVDELLDCRSRSELRETIQSAEKMSRFFKRLKKTSYYMKV